MNAGVKRGTTTLIRVPSDLDKGYIPNGVKQCQKNRITEPQNIMRTPPSLTATQLKATAAETMSRGFSIPHKPMSTPHEPTKAPAMLTIVRR